MPKSSFRFLLPCLLAAAVSLAAAPARADSGDSIHFAHSIHVSADAPVHDAVCFFCSVYADGRVTGDIVVVFGSVHLNGDAQHDVVDIFGNVTAEKGATIENDLVSVFGNIQLDENVQLGHDLVSVFGNATVPDSASIGGDRVQHSFWIAGIPTLILLAIVLLAICEFRAFKLRLAARRLPPVQRF